MAHHYSWAFLDHLLATAQHSVRRELCRQGFLFQFGPSALHKSGPTVSSTRSLCSSVVATNNTRITSWDGDEIVDAKDSAWESATKTVASRKEAEHNSDCISPGDPWGSRAHGAWGSDALATSQEASSPYPESEDASPSVQIAGHEQRAWPLAKSSGPLENSRTVSDISQAAQAVFSDASTAPKAVQRREREAWVRPCVLPPVVILSYRAF
jgi:hypothetical protein